MSKRAQAIARGKGEHVRSFRGELADQTQYAARYLPKCCDRPGFTYFIEGAGMVKIGTSSNPVVRLPAIQVSCPVKLSLAALSRGDIEQIVHDLCHAHRSHGEWFNADGVFSATRQLRSRARMHRVCLTCAFELNLPDLDSVEKPEIPEHGLELLNDYGLL